MKKFPFILLTSLLIIGVGCAACWMSYKDLYNADLFLYSTGLVGVAFIARRKFKKK